ncbi:hypothetical protein HPB47_013849 [Ixodes persulcatus]|uniref:Uncharacterized protein n=1 Tax=Ixodes persulcatus TaxID=34615 RepID=A0AC60R0V5_IXOPE|nr:hypothetical protein HPB47_013849 [Ixodes persulcatus]
MFSGRAGPGRPGPCLCRGKTSNTSSGPLYAPALKNNLEHAPVSALEAVEIKKSKDERLEVYVHVRELLARVTEAMAQGEDETDNAIRDPASKRRCLGLFQDWCDVEDDKVDTEEL